MKRHLFRISLVMLLGVVTSVAVAWGCIVMVGFGSNMSRPDMMPPGTWNIVTFSRFGSTRDDWTTIRQDDIVVWAVERRGWPFLALRCRTNEMYPPSPRHPYSDLPRSPVKSGVALPFTPISGRQGDMPRVLPLRPIWPGLLANTAIYGGVWWAILFGPGMLIRRRRRRAGRCVTCGYDLRGLSSDSESGCPECGAERQMT